MPNKKTSRLTELLSLAITVGLIVFAWINHNMFFDLWRLYGYHPSTAIVQLADQTTMTSDTRRLFYVYHPQIEQKAMFNQHCSDSEKTIVLGCYVSHRGIYLYDVTDQRLNGVEQVTAAHETLHAAYERLNSRERKHVNAMINAAWPSVTDPRIRATIADYKKSGADTTNELHSILGTEVRNLPPDLEQYYKQYFTDRKAVVVYSEQYESEFANREKQQRAYDAQLSALKQQIDNLSANLDTRQQQLAHDYQSLTNLKQQGSIDQYNASVPGYNSEVNGYNASVVQVRNMIQQYNDIVEKRNALVVEESQLQQAIDSRPQTLQQQ